MVALHTFGFPTIRFNLGHTPFVFDLAELGQRWIQRDLFAAAPRSGTAARPAAKHRKASSRSQAARAGRDRAASAGTAEPHADAGPSSAGTAVLEAAATRAATDEERSEDDGDDDGAWSTVSDEDGGGDDGGSGESPEASSGAASSDGSDADEAWSTVSESDDGSAASTDRERRLRARPAGATARSRGWSRGAARRSARRGRGQPTARRTRSRSVSSASSAADSEGDHDNDNADADADHDADGGEQSDAESVAMPPSEGDGAGSVDSAERRHRRRLLRRLAREDRDDDWSVTGDDRDGAGGASGDSDGDEDEDEDEDNEGSDLEDDGSIGSEDEEEQEEDEESGSERGGSDDDSDNGGVNGGSREDEGFERPWRLRRGVWTRERRWWQPPSMVRVRSPRRRGGAAWRAHSNGGARCAGLRSAGGVGGGHRGQLPPGTVVRITQPLLQFPSDPAVRIPPRDAARGLVGMAVCSDVAAPYPVVDPSPPPVRPRPFAMLMTGYVGVMVESDPSASSVQVALSLRTSAHVLRLWVPTANVTRVGELPPRDDNGANDAATAKGPLRRVPPQVLRQALAVLAAQRLLLSVRDGAASALRFGR